MDFASAVAEIFAAWSTYQYVVSDGMGGQYTAEKDVWFRETVADFIASTSNLDSFELADYMAEILNAEFSSLFEDGSVECTASLLLDCHTHLKRGRPDEVTKIVDSLRAASGRSTNAVAPEEADFGSDDDETVAAANKNTNNSNNNNNNQNENGNTEADADMDTTESESRDPRNRTWHTEPDDDGWCTVTKGRR